MVEALIVLFTLCGEPMFIVGQGDSASVAMPTSHAMQNEEVMKMLQSISEEENSYILEVKWEEVSGNQCT